MGSQNYYKLFWQQELSFFDYLQHYLNYSFRWANHHVRSKILECILWVRRKGLYIETNGCTDKKDPSYEEWEFKDALVKSWLD